MERPSASTSVSANEIAGAAARQRRLRLAPPIFDDARLDVTVLDHHGVVEHGHVGHAAVAVA
jgi:hypothetical protein